MTISLLKPRTLFRFGWDLEVWLKDFSKLLFGILFLALVILGNSPRMAKADVDVHIGIGLPAPIVFAAPPMLVVVPETYVYFAPDIAVDLFFYDGWWWRPWQGYWYRSRYYDSGWVYYQGVPSFYGWLYSGWRDDYRHHRWRGHRWNYKQIPYHEVERNWKDWERSRHWERQETWGVEGLQPRTRSHSQDLNKGPKYREGQVERSQSQGWEKGPKSLKGRPEGSRQQKGHYEKMGRGEQHNKGKVNKCVSC